MGNFPGRLDTIGVWVFYLVLSLKLSNGYSLRHWSENKKLEPGIGCVKQAQTNGKENVWMTDSGNLVKETAGESPDPAR